METLATLIQEQEKRLADPTVVMTDRILEIPLRIAEILTKFSGPIQLDTAIGEIYKHQGALKDMLTREATILKEISGITLSTYELIEAIIKKQQEVRVLLGNSGYQDICDRLGIAYTIHTDGKERPFVPTTERTRAPETGSGKGWEKEKRSPKLVELIEVLRNIETPEGGHIDTRDIIVDFQGETPDAMMRTLSYVVVRIPRLSRTILIDDRIGEATFVLMGLSDLSIIRSSDKGELKTHHHAQKIIYDQNWGTNLKKYLITDWDTEGRSTRKNTTTPRVAVDRASLFLDVETIRVNLENYATVGNVCLAELSTTTPKGAIEVELSNMARMTWGTFLDNASRYLLGTSQGSDSPHKRAEALYRLCEMVGAVRINARYFNEANRENLRRDLEKYAEAGGVNIAELSTETPKRVTTVELSNGLKMRWRTFLDNASQYFLGTENHSKGNHHRAAEALDRLYEIVEIIRVNAQYFSEVNSAGLRRDLEKYAEAGGVNIGKLSTSIPKPNTIVELSNGVRVQWETFLNNASQYLLGTGHRSNKSHKRASALDTLCKMMGVVRVKQKYLTEVYFTVENVVSFREDLEKYAEAGGVNIGKLSTSIPKPNTIVELSNGVRVQWETFLNNASQYLLGTSQGSDSPHKKSGALDRLLEMVGVVRVKKPRK